MSRENVEVIRRIYDRWEQERTINPDDFHPEFRMRPLLSEVEGHSYQGFGGYKIWRGDMEHFAEGDRYESEDFVELGDQVLVTGTWYVSGRISGAPVEAPHAHLWTFKDGRPWRWEVFRNKAAAFEAVGLAE
jgi:ketosteroid isomerase-like protein